MAQTVKHLPAMQETWDRFLGQEDPLEKEMAIHSSTFTFTSKEVCYPTGTSSLYPLHLTESKLLETGTKKILIHIKVEGKNGRP